MIKYRMSGFNEFDEIVIIEILATNHANAIYTAGLFDLEEILVEELEQYVYRN